MKILLFETKKSTQTGNEEQVYGGHKSEATLIQLISSVLDAVAAVDEFADRDNCNQGPDTVPSFNSVLDLLKTTQVYCWMMKTHGLRNILFNVSSQTNK